MSAILALEDGRVFRGFGFGATATSTGEICFNTSMTGYQEILTDPSYRGQIVAMTAPQIGNYGVNSLDHEHQVPQARAFVIEELSPVASSWRANHSLESWLEDHGIPGIQGIDTRALTRHLRTRGALRACVSSEGISQDDAIARARAAEYAGVDFVNQITTSENFDWDPDGILSRQWVQSSPGAVHEFDATGNAFLAPNPVKRRIVAYDFGIKTNILRLLRNAGFAVRVVPARTSAAEVLAMEPDGIFLSNGPGDPASLDYAHDIVRELIGKKPIFGICLGHQILGFALGGRTFKLKFGHRGANQPVKDLRTGAIAITSQNHGYALDPESLPPEVEVTHLNLNDGTVAGISHRIFPAFSVQYHPEASPGPHDAREFFQQFASEVDKVGVSAS